MTIAGAAPNQPKIITKVSADSVDVSSWPVLPIQATTPVERSVTIEVTQSSPYLEQQARERQARLEAEAAKQAAIKAANATAIAARSKSDVLSAIRYCESRNNYRAQNRYSSASGAYQFLDSTWGHFGGYSRAKDAPAEIQDQKAVETLSRHGTTPWRASRSCWSRYIG